MNTGLYNGLYSVEKILIRDIIFLRVAPCDSMYPSEFVVNNCKVKCHLYSPEHRPGAV